VPKATLTFDLDEPQERREHLAAVKGMDWALVVFEQFNWLHQQEKMNRTAIGIDEIREWLNSELEHLDLNLDVVE